MKKREALRHAQMVLHVHEHEEQCAKHISSCVAEGLNLERKDLGATEKQVLDDAAYIAYMILSRNGWDFMFSENGEFAGVVL